MRKIDDSRPGVAIALSVDAGVSIAVTHGNVNAAKFLSNLGIADRVIARVLCDPAHRRSNRGDASTARAPLPESRRES
jgi:hypothetical protein